MIQDHPTIRQLEREGLPEMPEIKCPVCGEECDTFFKFDNTIIGCENCVREVDAYSEITEREEELAALMGECEY